MSNSPPDLPLDICREILLWLPAESVFRFRSVCKRWLTAIDDPSFVRPHTIRQLSSHSSTLVIRNTILGPPHGHLYTFDLDAVNLFTADQEIISGFSLDLCFEESSLLPRLPVSACVGLILVRPRNPNALEIWNLSTRERLQLPPIENKHPVGPLLTGLGYDQAAQDFKAVAMDCQQTHVYSLRSDTWRTINGVFLGRSDAEEVLGQEYQGVFVCGAVHWLLDNSKIIALDLGNEIRRNIQLNASQKRIHRKSIDVLGGCLAVSGYSDETQFFVVWVMNDYGLDDDDDELWTKLFSMRWTTHLTGIFRPFAYGKDKNQVFLNYSGVRSGFFVFDVESDSLKRVYMHGCLTGYFDAQIIPQTIFKLRDNCGGGSGTSRIKHLGRSMKMKVSCTTVEKH